ncbi:hypothetical protein QR680_001399 [Steinernema hermaphroditum]|uniref:Domain of unknown function DB domain-containing protein n=1 Tax=Steinernema hermaphroditum TaxID=289476 RepID=A0AA39GY86_9BILA|nr:hypothetical protein QR680_001399 [Steinernema hermaphroditum]
MLTASVWKELSANWPEAYWDDWLRRPEVRKGRACIRPEVSRTAHNMKVAGKGSSNGLFKTFLSSIHLPDSPVDFSKVNVDSLKKKEYDVSLAAIVKNAEPLTFELLDGTLDATKTYKTIYKNPREFRAIAKKYKLMSDIRSGMARTAYYGIVPFMKDGSRVYAVHGNFDEKLLLNGTSSSYLYTADWDRMSRYLEFEELYCRPGKWTGKCDPADPGMTEWFKKRNRMRLLKILPQFMSARVQINVNTASKVCDFLRDNENILRIHIGESLGAVSTVHSTHTTTTIDFETAQLNIVRTSDQGGFEHYDFEWSKLGRIRYLKDTINLNEASWYGGPQTNNMQWPLPKSSHEFAPFITGDLFESSLNCYEPYWLSSNLVAVHVSDECVPLWTQHKEGYLNLQSLPYEAPFRNFQHKSLVFDYPKSKSTILIEKPIWTTWARYKETVNERSLLDFVGEVEAHGFEISQLELDDKWSTEYGEFEFDQHKFPNIPKVAELLKSKNIEFTLWIHPFVALSSKTAKNRNLHEIFVKTSDGKLGITRWWHGDSYILDITHPKACEWLSSELDSLRKLGVQRFKFDAGEVDYLPKDFLLNQGFTPNDFSKAFVTFASSYAAEVRTAWRTQKQGVLVRTMDRLSSWKDCGIETVLPILFNLAICGYHFNLPDMIGGNAYDGTHCDKELFIRWVQLNTFLFAMQFSISPWDYDEETVEICQKMMTKRRKYLHYLIKTFESATRGEVPIRPLWWVVESKEAFECDNQFFVGDDLMVAPVIRQHQRTRKVILPDGDWLGHDGVRCSGGTTVKVETVPPFRFSYGCIMTSSMLMTFLLTTTIIKATHACVASGVCGLGPCYTPTVSCMPGSCSPGYSCGNYGCARRRVRAHSERTVQGSAIFGLNRFRSSQQNLNPDEMFMRCCEERGLPDACLQKCTFQTFTKEALTNMYFKVDACPIEASAEIQFCAAQGRDHRECCVRNGVTTTLAGERCLTFCDQRPGNVTQLDMSYIGCYDRFEQMKSCFWHDLNRQIF